MPDSEIRETAGKDTCDVRIGKVLNDFLDRKTHGETVSEADLIGQYPEFADDLRRHLRFLRNLEPSGDQIGKLVAAGVLDKAADSRWLARLGPYEITGFLGRGGMSIVLKAYEESLDRTVALKVLQPELTHDRSALIRFAREAKAAAGLQHPNIVTVHAVGEKSGTHYLSMELIDGATLASLIRQCGPLHAETIRHLTHQILSGLGAAHRANLVHRDIKPSNILLAGLFGKTAVESNSAAKEGTPFLAKIADFGLARVASSHSRITMPDSVLGTPEYMSPEQARGEENIDHRADLYSVGVVLYEMLTGRTPFRADKASAVIHQILHDDPPDPRVLSDTVDPKLGSLALRLMAKRPEDRFESAEEALVTLDSGTLARSIEKRRRHRRRATAGILVLLTLATGGWLGTRFRAQAPISAVKVDYQDETLRNAVLARRGNSANWEVFHDFGGKNIAVRDAILLDSNGGAGADMVVVGLQAPADEYSVFGFDLDGAEVWKTSLTPNPNPAWPDFDGMSTPWRCVAMTAADLDAAPGDEVVVSARDQNEYPSCLTIIDPKRGEQVSTFFHMGEIAGILIVNDYFGARKPAIVAWGVNNKLDGYRAPALGAGPAITEYEQVGVVMILDPARMDGLGPPHPAHRDLVELGTASPWAYAFLGLAGETRENRGSAWEDPSRAATIRNVMLGRPGVPEGDSCFFRVSIDSLAEVRSQRAELRLSRELDFLSAHIPRTERHRLRPEDWDSVWRPIIQKGKAAENP